MMKLLYVLIVNVNSYAEEIFDLGTDSFSSAKSVIGSSYHRYFIFQVTSYQREKILTSYQSLHTEVTSYQATSYQPLHTNALHIRALHTDIGKVNKI